MATLIRRRARDGSPSWQAQVRVHGYPSHSKTFKTSRDAKAWASRMEAAAEGRTLAVSRGMTVAELIDLALPQLRNPATACFDYWREAIGTLRLIDVTPQVIAVHRDTLLGQPCGGNGHKKHKPRSTATVRNYMIELGRLFSHAVKEMWVMESNPCTRVNKPKASDWRVRSMSDDERERLLAACRADEQADLYSFVLFCLTTGCRKGEAAALTWDNVDLKRRWAIFPMTKNGTARGVPLTVAVAVLLSERGRTDARVFPVDITKAWHRAIAATGIENFRFHDLRHTCASTLVMNGATLIQTAALLGHKTPAMTMRYAHLASEATTALVDRMMGGVQ